MPGAGGTLIVAEAAIVVLAVFGAIILIPLIWLIATYNRFASTRQHMKESWAGVDVELKRRHDLVPNLVSTVKGYAVHEQQIFERLAELRSQAMSAHTAGTQVPVEGELTRCLHRLIAVAESYPSLKADRNFLELQQELALTEDRIAASRRFYNANVRDLNTLCTTFPSSLIAGVFKFTPEGFFELDSANEREAPRVT
ncbi:MAG: LemA family protein [Phycisphaerae bacterium]|nr:LemA family protein [Phycisphaerae bacterium]